MTEEEKKEFEEFLQWKAEKKKKKEEAKALEEAKLKQQKEEEKKKASSFVTTANADSNHSYPAEKTNAEAEAVYQEVSYSFEKKVGFCVIAFLLIVLVIGKCSENSSNKQRNDNLTPEQIAVKKQQDSIDKVKAAEYAKEKHRQDSIKRAERIELLKHTIHIKKAYITSQNSAGGVDAYFSYKNVSNKTIKYLYWSGYVINAVGDPVECEVRETSEGRGKDTGPIKPGRSSDGYWSCMWYNYSAKKLILTGVQIEYMDGSTISISKNELKYIR